VVQPVAVRDERPGPGMQDEPVQQVLDQRPEWEGQQKRGDDTGLTRSHRDAFLRRTSELSRAARPAVASAVTG
jgi:hypothetical protein